MHQISHYHDKTQSDYYLFPNTKKSLFGQKFSTDNELKHATEDCAIYYHAKALRYSHWLNVHKLSKCSPNLEITS